MQRRLLRNASLSAAQGYFNVLEGVCNSLPGIAKAVCNATAKAILSADTLLIETAYKTAADAAETAKDVGLTAAKAAKDVGLNACCFAAQVKCSEISC
jgi:hypothetical protein